MTLAEIQTEFTDSPCVATLTAGQLQQLIALLLWRNLSGDIPMTQADIQSAFDDAACVADLTSGQLDQLMVSLIFSGGGGSGSTSFTFGAADPVAPPSDPTRPAWYLNTTTRVTWFWDPTDVEWVA